MPESFPKPPCIEPRFSTRSKLFYLFVLICMLSPVDLIPDVVPILGQADDVVLTLVALVDIARKFLRK